MAPTTNRKLTNEYASMEEFIPAVNSNVLTRDGTQTIKIVSTNSTPIVNTNNFDLTDLKLEKIFTHEYYHRGADKKILDIINKKDKGPENLRVVEKREEIKKSGKLSSI